MSGPYVRIILEAMMPDQIAAVVSSFPPGVKAIGQVESFEDGTPKHQLTIIGLAVPDAATILGALVAHLAEMSA